MLRYKHIYGELGYQHMYMESWDTNICIWRVGIPTYVYGELGYQHMYMESWDTNICIWRVGIQTYVYGELGYKHIFVIFVKFRLNGIRVR